MKVNKNYLWCLSFLIMFATAFAAYEKATIKTPASTGLATNVDYDLLKDTDALVLQNTVFDQRIGRIERRYGIKNLESGLSDNIYSANSYFDTYYNLSHLVGLTGQRDSLRMNSDLGFGDLWYIVGSDVVNTIAFSGESGYDLGDSVSPAEGGFINNPVVVGQSIKFLDAEFGKIVYNNNTIPYLYTPYTGYPAGVHLIDTIAVSDTTRRLMSVSLEAPGQLRVAKYPVESDKEGWFRYSYSTSYGRGIATRWVYLDNESAMLSLFEVWDSNIFPYNDFPITVHRQKFGTDWVHLPAMDVTMDSEDEIYAVDSLDEGTSTPLTAGEIATIKDFSTPYNSASPYALLVHPKTPYFYENASPSGFKYSEGGDVNQEDEDALAATPDQYYYFCYSYYDPHTGQESPLGAVTLGPVYEDSAALAVNVFKGYQKVYTKFSERPPYIRIYRSIVSQATILADVSFQNTDWYCVAQVRANVPYHYDTTQYEFTVFPGWGTDAQLANGNTDLDSVSSNTFPYQNEDIVFSSEGGSIVRPPYVENLEIGFSSMAYANNRYWGVGDGRFPVRLYYSNYDTPYEWSAFNSLELFDDGTSDELVALAALPSGDQEVLYAFKHNSLYAVGGYDAEYDLSYALISREYGVVNSDALVVLEDQILFLSPKMQMISIRNGSKPVNVSMSFENVVEELFVDYNTSLEKARAYRRGDYAYFVNTDYADTALTYDFIRGIWSKRVLKDGVDAETSFRYNLLGTKGFTEEDWWSLETDKSAFIMDNKNTVTDTILDGGVESYEAVAFRYRSPYVSAEDYMLQIEQVDFTGYWGASDDLTLRLINEVGDTVATKVLVYDATKNNSFSIGFGVNEGQHLAVDFSTATLTGAAATSADSVWISDLDIKWRRIGKNEVD